MALMAQITKGLGGLSTQKEERWLLHLTRVIESTDFNAHVVTSLICHLSGAVSNRLPLPPYLSSPAPFLLARKLRKLNDGLLDMKNAEGLAFFAFASLKVLNSMVNSSLKNLIW